MKRVFKYLYHVLGFVAALLIVSIALSLFVGIYCDHGFFGVIGFALGSVVLGMVIFRKE